MANDPFRSAMPRATKPVSFKPSGGGNTLQNMMLMQMISQQKGADLSEQLGPNAFLTGGKDPYSGATFKTREGMLEDTGKDVRLWGVKEVGQNFGMANRTVQAMRNLWGYGQNIEKEFTNPITGKKGAGSVAQIFSGLGGSKFAPGPLQEMTRSLQRYKGQEEEVKMSMVPILSGQARYVVDLANAIAKTIPDVGKVIGGKKDLIAQSTRNIMSLTYGIENGIFNNEFLQQYGINPEESFKPGDPRGEALLKSVKLTPQQEQNVESAIQYVLSAPELGEASQVVKATEPSQQAVMTPEKILWHRQKAKEAIESGKVDARKVSAMFKQETGEDL